MKTAVIRARAEEDLAKTFFKECARLRVSESDAVRDAIRLWLHNSKRRKAPSPLPGENLGGPA